MKPKTTSLPKLERPLEIKSSGVVHNFLDTGEISSQKRKDRAAQANTCLADIWPKNPQTTGK